MKAVKMVVTGFMAVGWLAGLMAFTLFLFWAMSCLWYTLDTSVESPGLIAHVPKPVFLLGFLLLLGKTNQLKELADFLLKEAGKLREWKPPRRDFWETRNTQWRG